MAVVSNEPLGRRVYERHLDLLLAEELSCGPRFARWFLERVFGDGALPDGNPESVTVEVSRLDNELDDGAAGEDDLFVTVTWHDGPPWVVLVEDKLDAVLQPRQVQRYLARVEHLNRQGLNAVAAVVAPES
jgi:hypothetical protein